MCSAFINMEILKERETEIIKTTIDYVGLILLIVGIACLQILLDQGKDLDWFNSQPLYILAVISAIALSLLIIWELTEETSCCRSYII